MKYKDRMKGDDCNQSGLEASSDKFNRGMIARKSKAFERNNDQDKTYKDSIHGGKADLKLPSDFPKAYIEKGVAIEMEHTDDPMIATEIAIDHLTEFPNYYEELEVMEKKLSSKDDNMTKKAKTNKNPLRSNSSKNHLKLVDDRSFQIIESKKYSKIGFNEVVGLKTTLISGLKELIKFISDKAYWQDKDLKGSIYEVEYVSRDGFSAYSHNKGGIGINLTIPKCEESDWPFLEFGEYDENDYDEDGDDSCDDGSCDANLDIMFKLEDIEDNRILFYIGISGGNDDAPYFRKTPIIYESEIEAKSLSDLMKKLNKEVKNILNWFKEGYKKGPIKLKNKN